MPAPVWLELLSPLPSEAALSRTPVAPPEMIASGKAGPITGWQNVTAHLSSPEYGLRHVHITLDETGAVIAGGDHVMFVRETIPDGVEAILTDHESIGGRFETDGSFRGTCWKMRLRQIEPERDDSETVFAESSAPTLEQITRLRSIVDDLMRRAGPDA